ncbi:hypothetical protein [Nocardiopsis oceani]
MTLVACGTGRRGVRKRESVRRGWFVRGPGWVVSGLAVAVLCAPPAAADEEGAGSERDTGGEQELPDVLSEGSDGALVGLALSGGEQPPLPGEEVVYRVTVANSGEAPVEDGLLAQNVPESLEAVAVEESGLLEEGVANWRVDVPEDDEAVYTVRGRVPEDAEAGHRLVSTACLLLDRDGEPAACASDTLRVGDQTVFSRVGAMVDREGLLRAAGVGMLAVLVWLVWRQRRAFKRG